jgi:hypothetical protein
MTVDDANRVYFQTLANTRASLAALPQWAVVIIILLGILSYLFNAPVDVAGHEVLWFVRDVNVVLMGMSAVVFIVSMFRRLVYRFQVNFSIVNAAAALGLVYSVCLLTFPMVTFVKGQGKNYPIVLFVACAISTVAILLGAAAVHVSLLRRRLRVGHSEKRTIGNFVAVSGSNRSKIMWITLVVVVVVPNVLTSGQYFVNFLGAFGLIFLACVMPSLPVEFAYLAYLKSKDRSYWEERPRGMPKAERRRLTRKVLLWAVGIVVAVVLFWVFAKYGHS